MHDQNGRELEGRTAIVTGAGNGLGLAIARRLVAGGAKVLLVDRDAVVQKRVGSDDLPSRSAFALTKDLEDDDCAGVIFNAAKQTLGAVNILVNNAAWSFHKPMLDVTGAEFDQLIAINQRSAFFLAQEFCRAVIQAQTKPADPVIVNIASINALRGNPNLVAYAGTKGALVAMTCAMSVEMAGHGIRINSISPSSVRTDFAEALIQSGVINPAKIYEKMLIKRFGRPEEIADLVAYICSPRATFVTGANWVIDGGYMAL
jgi:NAD(P)-dependent dehydrogenase (short-subunit alcohol dehydrogenase family)